MNKVKFIIIAIIFTGVGMMISVAFYAVKAAWNTPAASGGTLTATMWNDLMNKVAELDNKSTTLDYVATKAQRGTTQVIPESVIINYCGDYDGCEITVGMYDWDGTGRMASRPGTRLWYNSGNRNWRAGWMSGDYSGSNNNGVREFVMNVWSCYFTDGQYTNWVDQGDSNTNFGILSWNEYNADCHVFIKD